MTNDYNDDRTPYGRMIRESKEEAFHARRKLRRRLPNPHIETKREVANALADYADALEDYADERSLETPWEERLPVRLDELLNETTTVNKPIQARNSDAAEPTSIPRIVELGPHQLLQLGKELDAIAKELGFAAEAKTSREQFHIAAPDQDHPEPVTDNVSKPGEPVQ